MVDSIGHAHAFGRGGVRSDFQYRFRREVDFGLGRVHARPGRPLPRARRLRRALYPGYFEDTDLCFKLHERGLKTIYEPRSRVVHVLHGSGIPSARG